jgi:hypothetical protein
VKTDITRSRIEVKYLIPLGRIGRLVDRISADEREEYAVTTVYFDAPDRSLSRLALESPYGCVKVRIREYLDGSPWVWLEVKSRRGAWTQKWRSRMRRTALPSLLEAGGGIGLRSLEGPPWEGVGDAAEARRCVEAATAGPLRPLGAVTAHRRTYSLASSSVRFTLDHDVTYFGAPRAPWSGGHPISRKALGAPLLRERDAVLELKHSGEPPLWCTMLVSNLEMSAYSKFRNLIQSVENAGKAVSHVDRL